MGPVLLVNVQNVDPQPVPLLEGPVAQVAGELPVALVHAARVLEVLVPVVLVRKHLPAPVALEALAGICARRGQEAPVENSSDFILFYLLFLLNE